MSEALKELKRQLSECQKQVAVLEKQVMKLRNDILVQQLDDWLEENGINTKIFPMNLEMFNYITSTGVPGTYIEYELDDWKPGTLITMKQKYVSDQSSVCAAPEGHHVGLFPPDMILRAVKESEGNNA